ncbi:MULTISPECIES: lysophospholipid acyltransferase family protein [unclassified Flavobacterium]|jgi:1-acyl-sn-glycerol-3-phosphate acyltransferase|nr:MULTISPECIES: lysophospholipid acyltransferase family protein [unclassified Flavobacterium]MDP5001866.1 1-acyl-sn-glycerol-3-phosphate acyltransferase [Flavobacterium sp.]MDP5026594.1 1-acyl-sn-glycerol-3-phosphate acyltransferase [Flavobacterium sp.]MDP5098058.1 1-acyl-sn-glycerol-3-phosphate acyltransferase [Flavobacterium sp.]MQP51494.1 1-acyl-sn-glycerol-3-phosphate acyltransferase [Flavobacterium sp. LMO9]MQP61278.1 1-acyl-sn-glycerol-3-phosphate acyltransferase [Flavobacterium sp. LMO
MKFLKYPLTLLYRIWFYILVLVPIIVLFPFIFATILSEKTYSIFFKIARLWSKIILIGMGFNYKIEGSEVFEDGKSYMLVANHTSMTDIMLMLIAVKNHPFVFVGKKELAKIPLFGFIYKRVCILVDRANSKSRYQVFERAQKRIEQGLSICIFPEGGVPEEHIILDEFKDGAFRIAIEHGLPIVPMVFFDNKKRLSYTFFSGSPGKMRAKIFPIIETKGKTLEDRHELKKQVRQIILAPLENDIK